MTLILFSLLFILITANVPFQEETAIHIVDVLPAFVGYMILWYALDKRKVNRKMRFVSGVVTGMTVLTFLGFLSQIRYLFSEFLNGDGLIIGWVLTGVSYLFNEYAEVPLLLSALTLGALFFAVLDQWKQKEEHRLQRGFCIAGMAVCGVIALCDIGALIVILPFSWRWISYPLSAVAAALLYFAMKDDPELVNGKRD